MRGVILAGGRGTRLGDATRVVNKHLLPVYDQPMIYKPIATLRAMGCDDILIVTGGENVGGFAELLGSSFTYRVQDRPDGIAGALARAEGYVDGLFPVILGDNYIPHAPVMPGGPALFTTVCEDPKEFGVYDPVVNRVAEKPQIPRSNQAVIGLYVYDTRVFDVIRGLAPSGRGELEITDVNNWYLANAQMTVQPLAGQWLDMGTPDALLDAAKYAKGQALTLARP